MNKSLFALILFSLISHQLMANTVQRLGLKQGLSNSIVVGITQDRQGIMWFATLSGLNRFDGKEFKIYTKSDKNSINGDDLNAVYADPKDNLIWIGTARRGLNVFDCETNTFKSYTTNPNDTNAIVNNGITDIKSDNKGNIWIATYSGGIDYFDKESQTFSHYNQSNVTGFVSNMVWKVADDQQGNLYIAHVFDGLSILSVKNRTVRNFKHNPNDPHSIPHNGVITVFIDSNKNIWVGTVDGLALFNPQDETFITFKHNPNNSHSISDNYINCINETNDKKLLIGTHGGSLNSIDLQQLIFSNTVENIHFEHIEAGNNATELSHPNIKSIFGDTFGNCWIGTVRGGLNFISNKKTFFHSYAFDPTIDNKNSLSHQIVSALCIDNEESLWVATDGGGIDRFSNTNKTGNYSLGKGKLVDKNITAAFTDSENTLWFGTFDGNIARYQPTKKRFNPIKNFDCEGIKINSFFEDRDKNIWIASNKGLHVYNLTTQQSKSYYTNNSDIVDNVVLTVTQDAEGNIWIGTLSGHIAIFDQSFNRIRLISPNNNLYGINQLYRDSKNKMWCATGEGLLLFNNWQEQQYQSFGTKNGLSENFIAAVIEGNDGRIWCSTSKGISCIHLESKTVKNYNHFDGLPLGDFMPRSVTKSDNGTIYFGSENGICYFDSNIEIEEKHLPSATITGFAVSNIEESYTGDLLDFPTQKNITLNHNQNTFTVSFNVMDYSYNNQVEFSYMLGGLEDAWYNVRNNKQVTFRNLPPGNYTFRLKSRYKNQQWKASKSSLKITINPPIWLSWWAKLIYLLFILMLIFMIIKIYINRLRLKNSLYIEKQNNLQQQQLNSERLKFYTNITHELRTPLTLILGPLEDLVNDKTIQQQPYVKRINSIHKSALRLFELINQILEFRKTETQNRKLNVQKADLSKQIREITLKYADLNRNPELQINCHVADGDFRLYYDQEVIAIMLDNLISNAIKYTPAGEIELSVKELDDAGQSYTEISVSDSGYGIDAGSLPHIFDRYFQVQSPHQVSGSGIGLSIVKNLVELHEGTITVESNPEKGTIFCIRLISGNTYPNALHSETELPNLNDEARDAHPILLVVEDNTEIREYISETFADDFDVLTAENGKAGLEIAVISIPDIIISDVMMPLMDGNELCQKVKEDARTSHIPFILLTAKDTLQDKTEGYTSGADSYITKPFSGKLLRSRVTNLLDIRKKMAAKFEQLIGQQVENSQEQVAPLDNEFIVKVTNYIEEHIQDNELCIATIADNVCMSHSTIYRKIKALTDLSTNEFIRKIRLQKARQLLTTGNYNISEIMYMVGINSPTYFRKCFKDEFGVSPSEYLKQSKN